MGGKSEKEENTDEAPEDNGTSTEVEENIEVHKDPPAEHNKVKKKTSSYHANCTNTGRPSTAWKTAWKAPRSSSNDSKKSENTEVKETSEIHEESPFEENKVKKKSSSYHEKCKGIGRPLPTWKTERKTSRSHSNDSKKNGTDSNKPTEVKGTTEDHGTSPIEENKMKQTSSYHGNCANIGIPLPMWKNEGKSSRSSSNDSKKMANASSHDLKKASHDDSSKGDKDIKKTNSSSHNSDAKSGATSQTSSDINKKKMDPITGKKKPHQSEDKNHQDNKYVPNPSKGGKSFDGFVPKPPSELKYSRSCNCVKKSSSTAPMTMGKHNQAASKTTKKQSQYASNTTEKQDQAAPKPIEKQTQVASNTTEEQNQDVKTFPNPHENIISIDDVQGSENIDIPQDVTKDVNEF